MTERASKIQLRTKIPPVSYFEGRFSFIDNPTLKTNIAISFQYIVFLIALDDELELKDTSIASSIYKDMIVQTGTIIESCIHHCLKKYIDNGKVTIEDVMTSSSELKDPKDIYKISNEESICLARRCKMTEPLTDQTQFIAINRAAHRAGILSETLLKKAQDIRELRNKIHLKGLRDVDGAYTKAKVDDVFNDARSIIETIEEKLS